MHASTPTIGTPKYVNISISLILIDKDAYSSVCNIFELPQATKHMCGSKLYELPNTTRASSSLIHVLVQLLWPVKIKKDMVSSIVTDSEEPI